MDLTHIQSTLARIAPGSASQLEAVAQQANANGWQLTTTRGVVDHDQLPGDARGTSDVLGQHLLMLPLHLANSRLVGIVSSRLGRSFDQWPDWFRALRCAIARCDRQRDVLVISPGTATAPFVQRGSELFGNCVMALDLPQNYESLDDWLQRASAEVTVPPKHRMSKIIVSPEIDSTAELSGTTAQEDRAIPLCDRALFGICEQIIALHVRSNGLMLKLLQNRLSQAATPAGQTQIALGRRLVAAEIRDRLLDQGAIGLAFLLDVSGKSCETTRRPESELTIESFASENGQWQFLTHCTRRRNGPWPDQTHREFLDDLVLQRETAHHSALDSLRHILQTNRLVASSESVRGSQEVVCFTAVPLGELEQLRVFRPHRGRWDFEPYGICIDRALAEQHGAAPVAYVPESSDDRDLLSGVPIQPAQSTTKSGKTLDWTVEQEWRHVGDLSLDHVPEGAAFVFVPTAGEALEIQPISRWPVVVLPR